MDKEAEAKFHAVGMQCPLPETQAIVDTLLAEAQSEQTEVVLNAWRRNMVNITAANELNTASVFGVMLKGRIGVTVAHIYDPERDLKCNGMDIRILARYRSATNCTSSSRTRPFLRILTSPSTSLTMRTSSHNHQSHLSSSPRQALTSTMRELRSTSWVIGTAAEISLAT
jgi:hypothetical protein